MELRHLRHFLVLAKMKHFHRAANQLNLAQPSLSRSIQTMEDRLGVKLLERNSKSVSLTNFGELVVNHGQRIISDVEQLNKEIRSLKGLDTGEIVIGASPIPSNSLIGPVIGHFIRHYPHISVELKVDSWQYLYQRLVKGSLSLFVAESKATEIDKREDLQVIPLPKFNIIFCCRSEHPLTKSKRLFLPSFRDYPLAIPRSMPQSLEDTFGDLFKKDRDDFAGLVRFDQFQPIKQSMNHCDMVAITPELSVRKEVADGSLVALRPEDMADMQASFSIVHLKGRALTPAAQAFVDFLLAESS